MNMHAGTLILCCSALSLAAQGSERSDPHVAGRSLAEWRDLMNRIELRDPGSRQFVPGLLQLMNDATVPWITRRQAALTLGRLGPLAKEAVPHLMQHLDEVHADDPETSPRRWALSALALFGREASAAAPRLIQLLNDCDSSVITKLGCLEALSQIGSAAPPAIPAIIDQVNRDAQPAEVALGAVEALGMIGPDAAVGVPVLMRTAQSERAEFRRDAVRSLGRMGPLARVAQPLLCDLMLDDDSAQVRDSAMVSLGQTGPQAWEFVEALLAADEAEIRERAVNVVAGWRTIARQIVPSLEPLLDDAEPSVRLAAVKSYRSLTSQHDRVWTVLIELLTDADRTVRRNASKEVQTIFLTGTASAAEIDRLRSDPRPEVQSEYERWQRLQRK